VTPTPHLPFNRPAVGPHVIHPLITASISALPPTNPVITPPPITPIISNCNQEDARAGHKELQLCEPLDHL
jgi:hypothetical protein